MLIFGEKRHSSCDIDLLYEMIQIYIFYPYIFNFVIILNAF